MSWLAESLIATGVLLGLVLILRGPVARRFGAHAAYALWLAPLMRLILPPIPLRLPASDTRLAVEVVGRAGMAETVPLVTMGNIAAGLWIVGCLAFLTRHALTYRRFLNDALRRGRVIVVADITDAAVIATPAVTGPAAAGLLIRRIFVPADFEARFSVDEQRLALAHEALHHRRGDLWAGAAALFMLALHWFNPLAHLAHRRFRRDLEASCDASLLRLCGAEARPVYARTILRCAGQPMPQTICALTPIGELKGRLEMLKRHHGRARQAFGVALAAALAGGGLFLAQPAIGQDRLIENKEPVRVEKFIVHGEPSQDRLQHANPGDLRVRMAKCDGEKFEAETGSAPGAEGKPHAKMLICAKAGGTKAETAAALERVLSRLEGTDEMPAENKAQIVAKLKARIAELKAGS